MELTEAQIDCLLRAGETEANRLVDEIKGFRELCKGDSAIEDERIVLFANQVLNLESLCLVMNNLANGLSSPENKSDIKQVATNNLSNVKELMSAFEIEALDERNSVVGILTLFPEGIELDTTKQEASVLESEINDFLD